MTIISCLAVIKLILAWFKRIPRSTTSPETLLAFSISLPWDRVNAVEIGDITNDRGERRVS